MASATNVTSLAPRTTRLIWLVALAAAGLLMRSDSIRPVSRRMMRLPRLTLWAWERPEDLRRIDPATTSVAYLDRTLRIQRSGDVRTELRMQPVAFRVETSMIAVVRIEVEPGATLSPEIEPR